MASTRVLVSSLRFTQRVQWYVRVGGCEFRVLRDVSDSRQNGVCGQEAAGRLTIAREKGTAVIRVWKMAIDQ